MSGLNTFATRLVAPITALLLVSASAMATPPLSQSRSFQLDASCHDVFPLFTARGEEQWAPGWLPEWLSGDTQRGSVFRTRHHDGRATVWVVTDYNPAAGKVSYARLADDSNMGLVDVHCSGNGRQSTVQVTYTLTGLNPKGDAFVAEFLSDGHYDTMIAEWKQALTAALASRRQPAMTLHREP